MLTNGIQALLADVLHTRSQACDAQHVRRAAFQEIRQLFWLRLAGRITASAALTPHFYLRSWTYVEGAGAGRAEESLVARQRE